MAPKKIVQDIIPGKRRSIRDVTLDGESPKKPSPARTNKKTTDRDVRVPIHVDHTADTRRSAASTSTLSKTTVQKKKRNKPNRKWFIGGIVIVCFLIVTYTASVLLARATIIITPQSESVPVSGIFVATRNAQSPDLSFETVSTTTVAHTTVAAESAGVINTYATGMALLVNASSPSSQKIIAGTRLTDDSGLVYKTVSTVIIPAATSKAAGAVAVKIIASAPGPAYNLLLTSLKGDLSITAWQGTPKAKIFYGRITTDIAGGSSGPQMIVASTTLANAATLLSSDLSVTAQDAIQSIIPSGYILYPSASKTTFSSTTITSLGSTTADVSMSATVTGIYFKRSDLENVLAKNQIAQFPADNYEVNGLDSLVFAPAPNQKLSFAASSIKFTLSGGLNIVGIIDTSTIKDQLKGISISKSKSVFSQYSSTIWSAQVSVVPFWIHTIPSSINRISVIISTTTSSFSSSNLNQYTP